MTPLYRAAQVSAAVALLALPVGALSAQITLSVPHRDTMWTNPRTGMRYMYYTGKNYGTDAQFNPVSEVLNEGFDVMGQYGYGKHLLSGHFNADSTSWTSDLHNVWRSVWHFDRTYHLYGWKVVKNELLPLSTTRVPGGGSWLPKYEAHMFGSGMVTRKMTEWYDMHGYKHPFLLSVLTMYAAHFANEAMENNGFRILNEDCTTDFLYDDPAGMFIWQWGGIERAFSGRFRLVNWPQQPSWNVSHQTLENTGQTFVLRGPIPRSDNWRWFYLFGLTGSGGITRVLSNGHSISVGGGYDAIENVVVDSTIGAKGVTLRPKAAAYWDKNGSLLLSVTVGTPNGIRSFFSVEAYPGAFNVAGVKPGLWIQVPRNRGALNSGNDGKFRLGLVSSWGVGIAQGAER